VGDDYLWVWADRSGQATVLRVRGELDVVTADRFIAAAASELRQTTGPVSVDLSFLDFLDCAGAHALEAVVRSIPPWRLIEVRCIQPPVARLLELIGLDLQVSPGHRDLTLTLRGQELLAQALETRTQSQEVLLESSAAMSRLATTYAGLAVARQRRAQQEHAKAAHLQELSDTAQDLATRFRERALCMVV
jgi:anti-anti-sigma factor